LTLWSPVSCIDWSWNGLHLNYAKMSIDDVWRENFYNVFLSNDTGVCLQCTEWLPLWTIRCYCNQQLINLFCDELSVAHEWNVATGHICKTIVSSDDFIVYIYDVMREWSCCVVLLLLLLLILLTILLSICVALHCLVSVVIMFIETFPVIRSVLSCWQTCLQKQQVLSCERPVHNYLTVAVASVSKRHTEVF